MRLDDVFALSHPVRLSVSFSVCGCGRVVSKGLDGRLFLDQGSDRFDPFATPVEVSLPGFFYGGGTKVRE